MRISSFILAAICLLRLCSSCQKEPSDQERPQVSVVELSSSSSVSVFQAGDTLMVSARLTDNQALANLFFEVKGVSSAGNWNETRKLSLQGRDMAIQENFFIPRNTNEGLYRISLRVLDIEGNFQTAESSNFEVINSLKPRITLMVHEVDEGDTLTLRGLVEDDHDIASISVVMRIPPGYSGNQEFFNEQINVTGKTDTLWDIEKDGNIKIYFPPLAKGGDYSLSFSAADDEGNFQIVNEKLRI